MRVVLDLIARAQWHIQCLKMRSAIDLKEFKILAKHHLKRFMLLP